MVLLVEETSLCCPYLPPLFSRLDARATCLSVCFFNALLVPWQLPHDVTIFGQHDTVSQTETAPFVCLGQIACSGLAPTGTGWAHGHDKIEQHLAVGAPLRNSLLDIVESQRSDPLSGVGVQVIVQRVYSLRSRDGARSQQRHTEGHAGSPGTW